LLKLQYIRRKNFNVQLWYEVSLQQRCGFQRPSKVAYSALRCPGDLLAWGRGQSHVGNLVYLSLSISLSPCHYRDQVSYRAVTPNEEEKKKKKKKKKNCPMTSEVV